MRQFHLIVTFLAAVTEAAPKPQFGDFANLVPALPGNIEFGFASSTRKSPDANNAPVKLSDAERFANGTTPGASADGRVGVILANDLTGPQTPGSKFIKRRHGPYKMKPASMFDSFAIELQPCKDCYITAMQAGLEYENGTKANIDTGAFLHHILMLQSSGEDPVCKIPPLPVNSSGLPFPMPPPMGRRLFASGNERAVVRSNFAGGNYGIKMSNDSIFMMAIELMNASNKQLPVYFTMSYEYVDGEVAKDYKEAIPVWLDITGCGVGYTPAKTGVYQYTSPAWTSDVNGTLQYLGGHEHDGGTDVVLYKNGQQVCISKQLYGHRRPGYGSMPKDLLMADMDPMDNMPDTHISDVGECVEFGTIKEGDKLQITANYDANLHPQMERHKKLDPVMGIAILFIGKE